MVRSSGLASRVLELPVVGRVRVEASAQGVHRIDFLAAKTSGEGGGAPPRAERWLALAQAELEAYTRGELSAFTVPVDLAGRTAFQQRVLKACRRIPYGAMATYGDLARQVGSPGAARAVGQVMAHNPVPLVIPCHRVVGRGGLTGFGGGLPLKERLLLLEEPRQQKNV